MNTTKISVKQPDEPVALEVLADSIVAIAAGIKKLRSTRLKDSTLFLLVQHAAPKVRDGRAVGIAEIKAVFAGIESLQQAHLKPPKK